jgi:sugar lactone lactonase YvrE
MLSEKATHLSFRTLARLGAFLFFLSFALFPRVHADAPSFESYMQRDGLASDYVTNIAFARDGAVWIGTTRGATQVQDKYWITYTSAHGLGNAWVSGIAIATDGKIYFATNGGGLTLFDGATRKTYNTSNSAIPSNYLTAVALDKQNRVWVGTYGAGAARLDGEQWTKFSLTNNYINALALDANGSPLVATNDGAFSYTGQNWTRLAPNASQASNRVNAMAVAPDGKIWLGTESGATVYDGQRYQSFRGPDGLASDSVRAIAIDAQNRVWFGTTRGVSVLEGSQWKTYTRADGLADDLVTALALDARGNAWIGTPRGLSVAGAALQRAAVLPVVLIHGWHSAESDHIDDTEFRHLRKYLERDGFRVSYATGISPYRTLFQNATTLRDFIADVKAQTGAARVDLIAFSMGGLNARAYLESSLYQNDVRRAIILGTPMAGARLWYPLLTREIEDRPTEPSVIELTPEYAALFNRTHAPRATVPYDLLTGDARTQAGLDMLKVFPASDGLIEQWSAHALSGPLVRRVVNADAHDWEPAPLPFNITAYLYPAQTYERFIRNALRDPDARPIGFAAAPVDPIAPRNITPLNVDTLRAGEAVTRGVTIDANRAARLFARWDHGDIDLKLRAPDGTRYTPDQPRDATYLKADSGNFIGYSIPRAQNGNWSLIATRLDRGMQPLTLTTYGDLDADVRLSAATDREWYLPGTSVIVTATLSNRATDADVRAKILWLGDGTTPRGASTEVKLFGEGEPGYYAQTIADLTRGGYYLLRITARGMGFAREQQTIFAVSPQTASFTGVARARVDGPALVIEADMNVARTGAFALAATLRGPEGQLITSLTAPLMLAAGPQTGSLAIPGRDIRARGIDGPYTVDLILMDASWAAVQVDEMQKVLTTDAYLASDFVE